jgi:hypothetical protein
VKFSRSEPGFIVSAAAHVGLLAAALLLFSDSRKFEDAVEAVAVDVVTDSQFNQVMKGEKTARNVKPTPRVDKVSTETEFKPDPALAEAKRDVEAPPPSLKRLQDPSKDDAPLPPKKTAALPPPAPTPPSRPQPQPAEKPAAKPEAKAQPEPEKEAPDDAEVIKPKPPVRPKLEKETKEDAEKSAAKKALKIDEVAKLLQQKKQEEKPTKQEHIADKTEASAKPRSGDENAPKSKFNAASIANLLSHEAPQRRASTGKETQTAALGAPNASASVMSPTMEAKINSYLKEHFGRCWQSSLHMNAPTYVPLVEFHLARDGTLEGSPKLLNPSSEPAERTRGEQALTAIRRCSPMPIPDYFPPYYEHWRVVAFRMTEDM